MTQPTIVFSEGFNRREIPKSGREGWWRAPDGQDIRRLDMPCGDGPERGSILFLPGRADFYEKYIETLDYWQRCGWNVTSIDWRGQGFSGRLGNKQTTGHIDDFGTWVNDLGDFWDEWIKANPAPHVVVGHSMGGHIALRALAFQRVCPDATVLSAPMLGFLPEHVPHSVLRLMARVMGWFHGRRRSAWRGSERPSRMPGDRFDLLTHDHDRYADEIFWRKERPQLHMSAPSWGWIASALSSIGILDEHGRLETIESPVMVVATTKEGLVSSRAIDRTAKRIPGAQLLAFGAEARHEILREVDAVRNKALTEIDQFLDNVAPQQNEKA